MILVTGSSTCKRWTYPPATSLRSILGFISRSLFIKCVSFDIKCMKKYKGVKNSYKSNVAHHTKSHPPNKYDGL